MKFKTKFGFPVTVAITTGVLLALALVVAVFFGGIAGIYYLLSISIWRIVGSAIIILATLGSVGVFGTRLDRKMMFILFGIGITLFFLPVISDGFGTPLSVILP